MLSKKIPGLFKEQVTAKVLFLCMIFFLVFFVNFVVDRVQLSTFARYDREIRNQQARSDLGKAIMHRLLMIELGVERMVNYNDLRKVDLSIGDINHSLDKLGNILNVLQHGGSFTNIFPANFYDVDEVYEQIDFHRDEGAGYVMEAIDLNPKIFELEEAINSVVYMMRDLLGRENVPTLGKIHSILNYRILQIDALILRARESTGKIFNETEVEINRLKRLRDESSDRLEKIKIGVLIFSVTACLYIFFRIIFNIVSILEDRENKARNLEEAKLTIETILDSIPVGMAIINKRREVVRINPAALNMFGVQSEEMVLGQRCTDVFCISVSEECPFADGIEDTYMNEVRLQTADGREITVVKNATYVTLSGERVILEAFMDISDRIEMEKRLQEQQEYNSAVLQSVQAGVVVISAETHTIVDMNEAAARLIGVNRVEAIGAVCHKYICPAEVGKCPVTDLEQDIDHAVRRLSNGKLVLKSVVPFKRGQETLLLENFVDITDRIEAEEQLKNALEVADSANKAKSELLSRMSHELRTPLNAIAGFSDLLQTAEEPLADKLRSHTEHIEAAGRHLTQVINEILDFSMIESGDFTISPEAVSAYELINDAIKFVANDAAESGITISVDEKIASLPIVMVDRTRFKQVLINLFSNGIKYNHKGGSLDITGASLGNMVLFTISDTGIGIPEDRQGDLFKPFSRFADADSDIEVAGIGLVISRQLIELMGGSIKFTSQVGQGTTFTISVPGSIECVGDEDEHEILPSILYIDDVRKNIENLRNVIAVWGGGDLIVRKSVAKGMRALPLLKPDAVLISRELAYDSLAQIIEDMRFLKEDNWVPIIAVVGYGEPMGADCVVPAPVTLEGLQYVLTQSKGEPND
ncbi:ATP-binding protein [Maridesulfovibrio sp.]|uniref:sensor histidine kinase n=1 Tax=Maridesulfovibrio sp. TaxID=2795000 RepID=UPI0029CA3F7B|nr:ATP-binding protein [Maridesulfovibrio sp.]